MFVSVYRQAVGKALHCMVGWVRERCSLGPVRWLGLVCQRKIMKSGNILLLPLCRAVNCAGSVLYFAIIHHVMILRSRTWLFDCYSIF
jgi:hypothetical protein